MTRSGVLVAALWLGSSGCKAEHEEATREAVAHAKDGYAQGVERAKDGYAQGVEQAKAGYDQGVEQAKAGYDSAKQGLADAREDYAVDEKVAAAQQQFSASMDDAADSFAELAEAGKKGAASVSATIDSTTKSGIEGAAEAIHCKTDPAKPDATRCKLGKVLLDKLQTEPKLLAREIMLMPKQGSTGSGLELVRLGKKSVPELLGLSRNDILLELNGISLGSLDAIRRIDEAMRGKPNAEIVYERDGERKTLVLERE